MDDLSAAIGRIMQDPESMLRLREMAASLGLSGDGQDVRAGTPPTAYHNATQNTYQQNRGMGRGPFNNNRRGGYGQQRPQPEKDENQAGLESINALIEQLTQGSGMQSPPPSPQSSPEIDISALSGILSGLTGKNTPPAAASPSGGNFDLSALSGILSGLGVGGAAPPPPTPDFSAPVGQNNGGGLDLSALSGILGSLGGGQSSSGQNSSGQNGGGLDLSALSGILGNLGGGQSSGGFDLSALSGALGNLGGGNRAAAETPSGVSALTAMLGGGKEAPGSPLSGLNMGMLLKFQQAMSGMSAGSGNMRLLLALKGHLKDETRIAKVDDAIRVMQVVQFLPLLKESGIFGKLEEIMGGFNLGGIGDLLGSLTGGR